jgi:hypothetical protein
MGTHDEREPHWTVKEHRNLQMLHLQAWPMTDKTAITLTGLYNLPGGVQRKQLGSHLVKAGLFLLPAMHQTAYGVLQESLQAWRELTSPK